MKRIPLTQGKFALVDDKDYDWLMQWKWTYANAGYAKRKYREGGKQHTVLMHRVITGAKRGQTVDHRDGDGLNNTRGNLRVCTVSQNNSNQRPKQHRFKGVLKSPNQPSKWMARLVYEKQVYHNGTVHDTPEQAARAYDELAVRYHGEFANLNFPMEGK